MASHRNFNVARWRGRLLEPAESSSSPQRTGILSSSRSSGHFMEQSRRRSLPHPEPVATRLRRDRCGSIRASPQPCRGQCLLRPHQGSGVPRPRPVDPVTLTSRGTGMHKRPPQRPQEGPRQPLRPVRGDRHRPTGELLTHDRRSLGQGESATARADRHLGLEVGLGERNRLRWPVRRWPVRVAPHHRRGPFRAGRCSRSCSRRRTVERCPSADVATWRRTTDSVPQPMPPTRRPRGR